MPAEFEHGSQTTNNDRLRHAGGVYLLSGRNLCASILFMGCNVIFFDLR